MSVILILDSPTEFPQIQTFLDSDILKDDTKYTSRTLFLSHDELQDMIEDTEVHHEIRDSLSQNLEFFVFSYDFRKISLFITLFPEVMPFFQIWSKKEFTDRYTSLRSTPDSDLFLPKIRISTDRQLDVLQVADLFRVNDTKTLKYINGSDTPILILYKGLPTFEYLNTFKSGVLVPATEMDLYNEEASTSDGVNKNERYVFQMITKDTFQGLSYSVNFNSDYNLVWTNVNRDLEFPIIKDFLQEYADDNEVLYLELEKHKSKFYISKINQGVHPYYKF